MRVDADLVFRHMRVIENAGDQPVAIFNRNQLKGYFVPASAVNKIEFTPAEAGHAASMLKDRQSKLKDTLDYLKDK